jgi:tetratricopeptide (TPR) repeat protein
LARRIARELEATIRPREKRQLSEERTVDSTAYALYLQARALRFQETGAGVVEAVRLLRQSVALDSTFAPAWAVLSTAAWLGPALGGELPPGLRGTSLAREAARRALGLDSTSAEAHVAMGIVQQLDGDYPLAGQHFKRALALNPGLANAYREFGLYLMRVGRFHVTACFLRTAAWLDPASPRVFRDLGENNLYRGRYEQAKRQLKKALTLQSDFTWVRRILWEAYIAQNSAEVARRRSGRQSRPILSGGRSQN